MAALLIAGCLASTDLRAAGASASCDAAAVAFLPSPLGPWRGAPLRVLVAADKPLDGELSLIAPNGKVAARSRAPEGGPPYFWFAEVASPAAGKWHAQLSRANAPAGCGTVTREIVVSARRPAPPHATPGSLWPIRAAWNRANENLYSAWIEKLFDAPLDQELSWKALHEVLRDRSRNMLFNHLGLREDSMGLIVRPDCADLPYFLRAYFAFKMGLPFGYSKCTRGSAGQPPKCFAWWNIVKPEPPPPPPDQQVASATPVSATPGASTPLQAIFGTPAAKPPSPPRPAAPTPQKHLGLAATFGNYLTRTVADGVHSGTARTALADNNTDLYPVPLTQEALRPGTVYADPYGHTLVLVKRVAQTDNAAGVLLAVDAQPDGTVARKRFWRGN